MYKLYDDCNDDAHDMIMICNVMMMLTMLCLIIIRDEICAGIMCDTSSSLDTRRIVMTCAR
jgi:hypothetical protein